MQMAHVKCPVKRLWISSLTDESIRRGFDDLKPQADYDRLYHAGMSRAIGDWLLGLNATRLYTLKYGRGYGAANVLSLGRVQTPTLALIVERHRQITGFVPEDYWELRTVYREGLFTCTKGKFKDPAHAQAAMDAVTGRPLTVTDVTRKKGREPAPRLFDLTSLQVECNKRWGWTADETLRLIQSLYEKKVTTYPRVDTTYLPDDVYKQAPGILRRMTPYRDITAPVLAKPLVKSKKVFDNSKVTDHHAIIPTGEDPRVLHDRNEKLLYHLIARRFVAVFWPDCIFDTTTVMAKVGDTPFKATGKVLVHPGWRKIYDDEATDKKTDNDDQRILPEYTAGEQGPHQPRLDKKTTVPPKPYTEGTLLRAMEGAGKTVDDETLREALKENGIGRPSTRSAIIETLFKRRYIRRERKNILPTQSGIDLIDIINEELLKSARLTGMWENKLRRIERGTFQPAEFLDELKTMVHTIVDSVMADPSNRKIGEPPVADAPGKKASPKPAKSPKRTRSKTKTIVQQAAPQRVEEIQCPLCHQGHLLAGRTAFGCSRYALGCTYRLLFETLPDTTPASVARHLGLIK